MLDTGLPSHGVSPGKKRPADEYSFASRPSVQSLPPKSVPVFACNIRRVSPLITVRDKRETLETKDGKTMAGFITKNHKDYIIDSFGIDVWELAKVSEAATFLDFLIENDMI